jgi:hypothetical protein
MSCAAFRSRAAISRQFVTSFTVGDWAEHGELFTSARAAQIIGHEALLWRTNLLNRLT